MPRAHKNGNFKIIRETLKKTRKGKKLSLTKLSNITGYSASAISSWEIGSRSPCIQSLIDWAHSLGYRIVTEEIQDN